MSPRALPFTAPFLLAPMEGVTEPCFRDLVLERNGPDELGGAFTEFVRVTGVPRKARTLHAHLGPRRFPQPVGIQLMGADLDAVARTAERVAADTDAPLIDLNFGCPAKGALRGCAGAALLDDPPAVEALVRTVVEAAPALPVTAKIRAGGEDDRRLEELAAAVEAGGAALLTVHCRTRREGYRDTADWERLRRAVAATSLPVCGNGGVSEHADLRRLLDETGCAFGMVGRAALADPWIFSGRDVSRVEAARFLVDYARELRDRYGAAPRGRAARVKQLLSYWTAGSLVVDDPDSPFARTAWLREPDPDRLLGRLEELAETRAFEAAPGGRPYTPAPASGA